MSKKELKNAVIEKVTALEDEQVLLVLKMLLDQFQKEEPYHVNLEERKKIESGLEQLKRGEFILNEELEKEEDEWLSK